MKRRKETGRQEISWEKVKDGRDIILERRRGFLRGKSKGKQGDMTRVMRFPLDISHETKEITVGRRIGGGQIDQSREEDGGE